MKKTLSVASFRFVERASDRAVRASMPRVASLDTSPIVSALFPASETFPIGADSRRLVVSSLGSSRLVKRATEAEIARASRR